MSRKRKSEPANNRPTATSTNTSTCTYSQTRTLHATTITRAVKLSYAISDTAHSTIVNNISTSDTHTHTQAIPALPSMWSLLSTPKMPVNTTRCYVCILQSKSRTCMLNSFTRLATFLGEESVWPQHFWTIVIYVSWDRDIYWHAHDITWERCINA